VRGNQTKIAKVKGKGAGHCDSAFYRIRGEEDQRGERELCQDGWERDLFSRAKINTYQWRQVVNPWCFKNGGKRKGSKTRPGGGGGGTKVNSQKTGDVSHRALMWVAEKVRYDRKSKAEDMHRWGELSSGKK